jgi:hypothetical protein
LRRSRSSVRGSRGRRRCAVSVPIEAKLTATPTARDAAGIEAFQKLFAKRAAKGYVVCLCKERFALTRSVDAVPLGAF